MGDAQIGRDVVLREEEPETKLLQLLPKKAQLGFSSLKDYFSQRNESGVRRFLQNSKAHESVKLEYTCIDVAEDIIVLGCSFGILFFYNRIQKRLCRFLSESKQIPIVCVKLLAPQNFVATGQFNGALTLFRYGKQRDGSYQVLLRCTIDDHHKVPVTCIEWTPDGTKLFSGDSEGNVAISVINMDNVQTHTVFICKENSPITQLSLCPSALLVSTLRRSLIWPFTLKTPVQVGQQERKVQGNFGACFYPEPQNQSCYAHHTIYAARPGLRIWRASIEGKVSTTMIFKDSISKGEPAISTLNLPSSLDADGPQSEPKHFGPLVVFASDFLLSWQGSCIWVLDPNLGVVVGCHSNFGSIVDVATCSNEMFVLSKSEGQYIRRIAFENRSQSPIFEVKELSFQDDETKAKIPRNGSVHQFEEHDKIDKIIGGVMSTTVGFISGVKRNVVRTIEQIKTRDESEESASTLSSSSSEEADFSIDPSSPIAIIHDKEVNGALQTIETPSEGRAQTPTASPCVIKTPQYLKNGSINSTLPLDADGISPVPYEVSSENKAPNFQETGRANQEELEAEKSAVKREIEVTITHEMREKETPFQHISSKDFNSDIVFEGTSKRKPKKSRKSAKANKDLDSHEYLDDGKELMNEEVMNVVPNNVIDSCQGVDPVAKDTIDESMKLTRVCNEPDDISILDIPNSVDSVNANVEVLFRDNVEFEGKEVQLEDGNEDIIQFSRTTLEAKENQKAVVLTNDECCDIAEASLKNEKKLTDDVEAISEKHTGQGVVHEKFAEEVMKWKVDTGNREMPDGNVKIEVKGGKTVIGDEGGEQYEHSFDPTEVLNVEIALQEPNKSTQAGEPCKQVQGEAVERTHCRAPSNSRCLFVDQDDSIDANIHWMDDDDDDEQISLDCSPPHSPVGSEHSLFPAPQMNYHSIYSQDTVSLSEISISEPEYEVPSARDTQTSCDNDCIDSLANISIDSSELADTEDNQCHSPALNLDRDGGVELTEASFLRHRYTFGGSSKGSRKDSSSSSPSIFEIDSPAPLSPHSMAEKVSERLRLLADSWADILLPSSGSIQSIAVTDTLVWCVDSYEHLFVTQSSSADIHWRKVEGKLKQISGSQSGAIVWGINRKKFAMCRMNVKSSSPQGTDWKITDSEVLEIAVDDTCVWGIRTNGDVFIRTGVSAASPEGKGTRSVRAASDLVHISALGSMVWGLDIYNHVQIYQGDLSFLGGNEQSIQWLELPGIIARHVSLGPKGVCWIIDRDGKIWFNLEVSDHNFFGGKWYQLSMGEYLVQDPSIMSSVVSFFKRGNEPKILTGNDVAGVWILSKHGTLHASRGHLLGTRWDVSVPIAMASSAIWTGVSSQGTTGNGGFIWALQPNGDLHCFRPESKSFVVQPPPKTALKFISASPRSLWALSSTQDVYMRKGISETAPQGLKWMTVNMSSMGSERICSIACGILVVWAVDFHGNVWFQMGKADIRQSDYSPAWIQAEGSPFDGCRFTKVAIGANDCNVWAIDDRNNVYARRDVTESFLIGTAWEIVAGTGAKDITISDNFVWALSPVGDIVCRFGISLNNFIGNYWKTVPGRFEQISVTADDELWGIDRQGQLYQRQSLNFFGTQATKKVPSYSQLFSVEDDWELI